MTACPNTTFNKAIAGCEMRNDVDYQHPRNDVDVGYQENVLQRAMRARNLSDEHDLDIRGGRVQC